MTGRIGFQACFGSSHFSGCPSPSPSRSPPPNLYPGFSANFRFTAAAYASARGDAAFGQCPLGRPLRGWRNPPGQPRLRVWPLPHGRRRRLRPLARQGGMAEPSASLHG
jgi:hypothetical protein